MYRKEVEKLRDQISLDLRSSARSYYEIGIDAFHKSRMKSWVDFQPAIGNLCVSVELLLKSVTAQKALYMLYTGLPDEAKLLLCYPESLSKDHNSVSYISDLKYFSYKTIELEKAASLFFHFYPEIKQEYKGFFFSLSSIRNVSVHASVPDFQRYELESIAYHSTRLFQKISELSVFKYFSFTPDNKTENFLLYYEGEKVKKVKDALDSARKLVKSGKLGESFSYSDDWTLMIQECPICGENGVYSGETEESSDGTCVSLSFLCESFECDACGLRLEDFEELELAGMETSIDRDNDVEQWCRENGYDDDRWAFS
ncbi:hypothetical protein [Marinobacter sediminicola]|uniref:hypothetical protein n=1 Tax=Marinobacter sediminicola TaxID=3072994 RepID=UPI002811EDB7|nr:hypothetical protein [Marinobacter sp. F26243]